MSELSDVFSGKKSESCQEVEVSTIACLYWWWVCSNDKRPYQWVPTKIPVTLVVESRKTYFTTRAGYKGFQRTQRYHINHRFWLCQNFTNKQLAIQYGIFDGTCMSVAIIICVLSVCWKNSNFCKNPLNPFEVVVLRAIAHYIVLRYIESL